MARGGKGSPASPETSSSSSTFANSVDSDSNSHGDSTEPAERLAASDGSGSQDRPGSQDQERSHGGSRNGEQGDRGVKSPADEDGYRMRHGWDSQYSAEQLRLLATNFYMYYNDKRHESSGNPRQDLKAAVSGDWRMRDRLKTVSAVLAICLNIGVDPPDVFRTNPCARLECWIDPTASTVPPGHNALNQIGKALQTQYEQLSVRTRYKVLADPTVEETKKYCCTLRRNAKDERILFHYNGHGVPKPTPSGEIWVFNKDYTQYIPIPLSDLQSWLSSPSLFVYDCSEAGLIVKNFNKFVEKWDADHRDGSQREADPPARGFSDCIHLAACMENETLPTNPQLPADLFTSCLTTPIEIAVRFFMMRNPLPSSLKIEDAARIPGRSQERRTPIGELNWIFTAITDTIAWNSLPKPLFKKLFRQDLMVAALFRNFLLAQRIMRMYHCHPVSYPEIPSTHDHPLWNSWDLAIEMVLAQLPNLKLAEEKQIDYQYQHSEFFYEQLTAFEVYLDHGAKEQQEPEQLPIVLQVLLSQVHRLRALVLLSRFLDLGPWAVELALSIGIFPYVLKLLQSQAVELKPPLVFIWARILAVDQSCQGDLLKDNGYQYFVGILHPSTGLPVRDVSEHRAMCAFIIAMFCRDFRQGQVVAHSAELVESCLSYILLDDAEHPLLRQWSCLCLSMLWNKFTDAKWSGIRSGAHQRLCQVALDPVPEVRAAMLHALTTFLGIPDMTEQVVEIEQVIAVKVLPMTDDGSSLVRKELTTFLSAFVFRYQSQFVSAAFERLLQEARSHSERIHPEVVEALGLQASLSAYANGAGSTASKSSSYRSITDMTNRDRERVGFRTETSLANSWDSGNELTSQRPVSIRPPNPASSNPATSGAMDDKAQANHSKTDPNAFQHSQERILDGGPVFSTIWKHIIFMSVDPDYEVARHASIIVDYIVTEVGRVIGPRAQLLMKVLADLKQIQYIRAHETSDDLGADGSPMPSPVATLKGDSYFSNGVKRTASVATSLKHIAFGQGPVYPMDGATDLLSRTPSNVSAFANRGSGPPRGHGHRERTVAGDSNQSRPQTSENPAKFPTSKQFPILAEEKLTLPIQSDFFDWSMEYFKEPQMRQTEADEPGSTDYNERLWRRNRNEKILDTTQKLKEQAGSSRWDHPFGSFDNERQPTSMCFHQYDDHLVVTDNRNSVRVWDWNRQKCLNKFHNSNPPGTRVTGARFINEDDQAMLMTGCTDGVIRVFGGYDSPESLHTVSAFRASTDVNPTSTNAGFIFDWVQGKGHILVAGESKEIQLWSARTETCFYDIPTGSNTSVTSLTSDQLEGYVFAAGFADGAVRIYDQRVDPARQPVREWKEHSSAIKNIHLQRGGQRELVSGSSNGEVKLWDIRYEKSCLAVTATRDRLKSLSVHEHAPVFAIGSERHNIKVFNMKGSFLSSFEPLGSFLHQNRTAPISTTIFHPHRMILACASVSDSHVSLFSCTDRKRNPVNGV